MAEILKVPDPNDHPHLQEVHADKPPSDNIGVVKDTNVDVGNEEGSNVEFDYPDGGLRAWLIVAAAACVTTSTFGVVNSFVRRLLYLLVF